MSDRFVFFERPYPSANAILLCGPRPILIDPGFGSDVNDLLNWLGTCGVSPDELALIVNTHYHSDHVGGNHALQSQYGTQIAAHAIEADAVNRRDPNVCAATWLRQPVEAYDVQRPLNDGDVLDTGATTWEVLHTPGHTRGHVSLYSRVAGVLVAGDTAHAGDLGWLNPYVEGADSLEWSLDTLARLASLAPRMMCSGHAAKRIFAYALMIESGLAESEVVPYLASSAWVDTIAESSLGMTPDAFARDLVDTMLQSNAIAWRAGRLVAQAPHVPPPRGWAGTPTRPAEWRLP